MMTNSIGDRKEYSADCGAMGLQSNRQWFRDLLQPLIKVLWNVPPDVLTWSALGLSIVSGVLLFSSYDHPWMAVATVPLLVARIVLNTLDRMLTEQTGKSRPSREVLNEVSDRLGDVAIFLGLTLSPAVDNKVLGLLALIAVMMVSYVGMLGKAVGAERVYSGMLGKEERLMFLVIACLCYGLMPDYKFMQYSIFSMLFLLFIPLASITLLQRLDMILCRLTDKDSNQ
jgi:phosphatidylglycerophosphate synthase